MTKELMNKNDIDRALIRMAHEIIEKNRGTGKLCLVGIQRGDKLFKTFYETVKCATYKKG